MGYFAVLAAATIVCAFSVGYGAYIGTKIDSAK